jgi:hypothetical protein
VLEFDHLDAEAKAFTIGQSLPYRNWQAILDEIEKCEVVCATAIAGAPLCGAGRYGRSYDTPAAQN